MRDRLQHGRRRYGLTGRMVAALLSGWMAAAVAAADAPVSPESLFAQWREWARAPGSPGNLDLEAQWRQRAEASGLPNGTLAFDAPVFLPGRTSLRLPDGSLHALKPMHPSLMRPGNFADPRWETHLVYLGRGRPEDLERARGLSLKGTVAVMEFDGGDRWLDLLRFGIKGVVFLAAPAYTHADAVAKVFHSEMSVPRFLAPEPLSHRLRGLLENDRRPAVECLSEPSIWTTQTLFNPWILIPGSDPDLSREVVLLTAALDANSVVPEDAHGEHALPNLIMLADLLDHWRRNPPRRSMLLVAVNAHTQAFLGERVLAWHVLMDMASITQVRDMLAREMRINRLFQERYAQLRLQPVDMSPADLNAAMDVWWHLEMMSPSGRPDDLDPAVLDAAAEAAIEGFHERMRGIMARMTLTEEVRENMLARIRRLEEWRRQDLSEQRASLRAALPTFEDERILEEWRAAMDASTGVRLAVKSRLQEAVKRELNMAKMAMMDESRHDTSDPELDRLAIRRQNLSELLVMFNKVDIGRGRVRVRYRDIALVPPRLDLLTGFRDRLVHDARTTADFFEHLLEQDSANGRLRAILGTRQVRLALDLGMDWTADRAGFLALNGMPLNNWYLNLGAFAAQLAQETGGWPEDATTPHPYVDALSGEGGNPQESYFSATRSPAGLFHAAGGVPSLRLQAAFSRPRLAFTPRPEGADPVRSDAFWPRYRWMRAFLLRLLDSPELSARNVLPTLSVAGNHRPWSCLLRVCEMDEFAAKPTPSLPVPDALIAAYSPTPGSPVIMDGDVAHVFSGISSESGYALFYGLRDSMLAPLAYRLDARADRVVSAIDKGRIQQSHQMDSNLYRAPSKLLPMFPATEFVVWDRVDPSRLGSRPVRITEVRPISGQTLAEPRKYGVHGAESLSRAKSHIAIGPIGVYTEYTSRRQETEPLMLLTGDMRFTVHPTPEAPEGIGIESPSAFGPDFFLDAAHDMDQVVRHRVDHMPGIVNELVAAFLDRGRAALETARDAVERRDHPAYRRAVALALGCQAKAYEQVRSMNADMLKAIMIYMALMLPFCFFLQKLLFNFSRIEHELGVFVLLFIATYTGFRLIHPAFAIAMSPEAIFLAFVLGAVGCFVVWMLHSRFSAEMDLLFRGTSGLVGEAGAGFVGQTAMLIGVNNMKRRRTRTALTTATIVLVVFTMLAFSSVSRRARPTLVRLSPESPYNGIFFYWPGGAPMDDASPRVFETLFQDRANILSRWVAQPEGGPAGSRVRWRIERVDDPECWASVAAAQSLSPDESAFVGPLPMVAGRIFDAEDAAEILLPASLAEALRITPGQVGHAQVRLLGTVRTVVGILDDDRIRLLRDLHPRFSLLPRTLQPDTGDEASDEATLNVGAAGMDLSSLVFLPPADCRRLGGRPVTVSVRLESDPDAAGPTPDLWEAADDLLHATEAAFCIGSDGPFRLGSDARRDTEGGVYQVAGAYRTTIGGLTRLVIPLLIAGLILFNTMLGTVYERKSEIAIYNAIGLNPHHIFAFFLAEALVYGVIGAIGGYLIGQILAITAQSLNLVRGMNVNFSSLMVVWAILFTVGLVLLSTLYPAFVATRTAVPSGTRRWALPPHDGSVMLLDMPFIYEANLVLGVMAYLHEFLSACTEESLGELLVTPRERHVEETSGTTAYRATYSMALAPYDLGVTQTVELEARYRPDLDSYFLHLIIRRESGQDSSWAALNQPMLENLRKMLLRWRNMDPARRLEYAGAGRHLFEV